MTDSTVIPDNGITTKPGNAVNAIKFTNTEKPNGDWNKAEVIVKNGDITHLLNGVLVNTGKLVNNSGGAIVLQSEGAEIYYRNIEIIEL